MTEVEELAEQIKALPWEERLTMAAMLIDQAKLDPKKRRRYLTMAASLARAVGDEIGMLEVMGQL